MIMAFYPCGNGVYTKTYSLSRNGTFDMGEIHEYRYVNANVLPAGGMSLIYRGEFPGNHNTNPASVTFNAVNNGLYVIHLRWVSKNNSQGWEGRGSCRLSFGGSARYWNYVPPTEQSNARSGGDQYGMAYNASQCAYVVGNGSNVTVNWYYNMGWGNAAVIEIYRVNW